MYYVIFGLLGAALLGADQWVKAWVVGHLQVGETTSLFPGFLELMRVHNYGAAWSSFAGQKWLLLGVTGVILAVVLWVLARKDRPAPAGDLRLLPDPLRRHRQYHRPTAAGLCGGYAPLPVLAQLSHVQRGGCVHRVRGYSGRDLLRVTLR